MMRLRNRLISTFLVLAFTFVIMDPSLSLAQTVPGTLRYSVTLKNITRGQGFSPPVAVTHQQGLHMFEVGKLATDAIAAIAQDGNPVPAFNLFNGASGVTQAVNVGKVLTYQGATKTFMGNQVGDTLTFEIRARPGDKFSIATMLMCGNDGFLGLDSVNLPSPGNPPITYKVEAYDAGRENNTEKSEDMVDPCSTLGPVKVGNDPDGNRDAEVATSPAQPIVKHPGIKGVGDLTQALHGWEGPVANIIITSLDAPLPATGVVGPVMTFPETGYSLSGSLLNFWNSNGGLPVFGFPIDSERQVNGRVFQWFERNRLELHPENQAPYNVELGLLGVETLNRQGIDWKSLPKVTNVPAGCSYFGETGHSLCSDFLVYWQSQGLKFDTQPGHSFAESLALFGFPISEPTMETNSSGDLVMTQWFERARLEFHPSNPAPYRVLLGRLGAELFVPAN